MLTNKQCPKCGGNIYLNGDYYGRFEQCLQCGYIRDLDTASTSQKQVAGLKKQPVSV